MSKKKKFKNQFDISVEEQMSLASQFNDLVTTGEISNYNSSDDDNETLFDKEFIKLIESKIQSGEIIIGDKNEIKDTDNNNKFYNDYNNDNKSMEDTRSNYVHQNNDNQYDNLIPDEQIQDINDGCITISYNDEFGIISMSDQLSKVSVKLSCIDTFDNPINNDYDLLTNILDDAVIKIITNMTPTAIFRKEDFISSIAMMINDYDTYKFRFFEYTDNNNQKYILCYVLESESYNTLQDVLDIAAKDKKYLPTLNSLLSISDNIKFNKDDTSINNFITLPYNKTEVVINKIFEDKLTEFSNSANGDKIMDTVVDLTNYQFMYLKIIDRIINKMNGNTINDDEETTSSKEDH